MHRPPRISRVLFLLPSSGFGGAERHTAMFARHLRRIGCAVTIAGESAVLARLRAECGPVAAFKEAPLGWQETSEFTRALDAQHTAAVGLLASAAVDVALLPLPWPNFGLGIQRALEDVGIPALTVAHLVPQTVTLEETRFISGYLRRPESGAWVAVSTPAAERLETYFGLRAGRVRAIPNASEAAHGYLHRGGARVRAELGVGAKTRIVLFAGRLDRVKGADRLPGICQGLTTDPRVMVVCAGEGMLAGALERVAEARGNLRLLGYRRDVPNLIAAADALILPSRLEGWPLVFQEAAALGCPVVASPAALECLGAAAKDLAMIAEPEEASFARAIISVLDDQAARARLVTAARAHGACYGMADMWARYTGALHVMG